jgi:hypothetical protein
MAFTGVEAASSAVSSMCDNSEDSIAASAYNVIDIATVKVPQANLVSGHEYLIIYNMAMGGTNAAGIIDGIVRYGTADTIAHCAYETDAETVTLANGPASGSGGGMYGFYFLSANGSDSIWLEAKWSAAQAGYLMGKCLTAIDLNNLTENTHYWQSVQTGDATVATDTTTSATDDTALVAVTFNLPATEDYLVLASAEFWGGNTATGSTHCFLNINGATQKQPGKHTWEDNLDRYSFAYASLQSLSSGNNACSLMIGNADGNHDTNGRRGRIIIIRKSAYVDIVQQARTPTKNITTDYNTWSQDTSLTYTNNTGTTENIVFIAHSQFGHVDPDDHTVGRLLNNTDAVSQSEVVNTNPRETQDTIPVIATGFVANLADGGAKEMIFQVAGDSTATNQFSLQASLIAWNMKESTAPPATAPKRLIRLQRQGLIGYEPPEEPIKLAREMLKLPECNCEE